MNKSLLIVSLIFFNLYSADEISTKDKFYIASVNFNEEFDISQKCKLTNESFEALLKKNFENDNSYFLAKVKATGTDKILYYDFYALSAYLRSKDSTFGPKLCKLFKDIFNSGSFSEHITDITMPIDPTSNSPIEYLQIFILKKGNSVFELGYQLRAINKLQFS